MPSMCLLYKAQKLIGYIRNSKRFQHIFRKHRKTSCLKLIKVMLMPITSYTWLHPQKIKLFIKYIITDYTMKAIGGL